MIELRAIVGPIAIEIALAQVIREFLKNEGRIELTR